MMARPDTGWVKMHRAMFRKFKGDPDCFTIFSYLIAWANYEDGKEPIKKQLVRLRRGELVTSLDEIVLETGCTKAGTRRCLKKLKSDTAISTRTNHQGTIITICNYEKYQGESFDEEDKNSTRIDRRSTHDQHNKKNIKKLRNPQMGMLRKCTPVPTI